MTTTSGPALQLALVALLSAACAGGQTGEEEDGRCQLSVDVLGPDQPSRFGFTPRDLLAETQGDHVAAVDWLPAAGRAYGPEHGTSELELRVEPLGTARELTPNAAMPGCCVPSVQLDVHVSLRTRGGAFDESFDAALLGGDGDVSTVLHHLHPERLQGAFAFDSLPAGEQLKRLELAAHFGSGSFSGSVAAGIQGHGATQGSDSNSSFTLLPLAEWGALPTRPHNWCSSPPP